MVRDALCLDPLLARWTEQNRLVAICPEVMAGASIPRAPSEIVGAGGGAAILQGQAYIINKIGQDVTLVYKRGAELALQVAKQYAVKLAILKENSPSCGSQKIYDGSFSGKLIAQQGVTAALLKQNGVKVFNEHQLAEAECYLQQLEAKNQLFQG